MGDAMNKKSISESELKVMEKIWASEQMLTIAEILAALREDGGEWSYNTVAMLLTRLAEKKYVSSTKSDKNRLLYFPLVGRADFNRSEAKNFVSKFGGTLKDLLSAFSSNKALKKEEIEELQYKINYKITYIGEPIKQKWNGLAQHVAFIIAQNADPLVLTLFSTLENVSIYSVYNLILNGMRSLFSALDSGVAPIVGNMMVNKEKSKLLHFFESYECIFHLLITFVFTVVGMLILPFISIYTKGINDADYIIPAFATIITVAVAVSILRTPYNILVLAAGHYKQTQWSSILEALINVIISSLMVFQYGLIGVAIGTLVAMSYRTCYLVWYLSHNIVNRKICYFVKHIIVDVFCIFIMIFTMRKMFIDVESYVELFYLAVRIGIVGLFECTIVHVIVYNKTIFKSINMLFAKKND